MDIERLGIIANRDNIIEIKSTIESYIACYNGDKDKCDKIIEYFIKNSSFNWEEEDGRRNNRQFKTKKEEYIFEKMRLVENFTRERYEKVIELYREIYSIKEEKKEIVGNKTKQLKKYTSSKNPKYTNISSTKKNIKNEKKLTPLVIAAGVATMVGVGIKLLKGK